ncbi:type I-E CRISPR-associated protein Cas5/CasD [Roseibium sp. RKSG952]|uniref:type I-E CRISPR-associated protein Cas5/CasD n=1 Tax=Roseibium sp. RKSG952 TaxID=2529384 RepID=UPI0012BD156F|nr:type I-E CRISPR-associated protein Cas5/CasD [Roseibium sp. RKSG952]MTH95643.1 type I-E CRISPR-associated protein Cas5/CasD [Roseibium sp. RKSG952]
MKTLILKLEGPMASFGDVAVDETRPTARHPLKSMIVGLLGNALGYKRTEGEKLEALQSSIIVASRLDRPGKVMTDYQTALTNANDPEKPTFIGKNVWTTRPVNMRTTNNDKNPIQIYRDYLTDVSVTVAIGSENAELINLIANAVKKPVRPLFLGRKACPPTRPIFEAVIEADSLHGALATVPDTDGHGGRFSIRTEASEKHLLNGAYREISVRDLKNWKNNFHSDSRRVVEGIMEITV